jgi:hypothetical protein
MAEWQLRNTPSPTMEAGCPRATGIPVSRTPSTSRELFLSASGVRCSASLRALENHAMTATTHAPSALVRPFTVAIPNAEIYAAEKYVPRS